MSNPWHLAPVLHYVGALKPLRVLDVGIGLGTYGFMIRQFLDIGYERLSRNEWLLVIDGIEIFEPYRNPVWAYAYNTVHLGDVRELLSALGHYDVIVCNDVLEHFEKAQAIALVSQLLTRGNAVIATTPNREWPQGSWAGNEAETHRCLLTGSDIPNLVVERHTGATACFIASKTMPTIQLIRDADASCPNQSPSRAQTLPYRVQSKLRRLLKRD